MLKADQIVRLYEDLAYVHDRQGQARLRDCYLMLAADAAATAGRDDVAERIRVQLLSFNPHHLLRPYASFADALRSPDIQSYIEDLRRSHPPDMAGRELQQAARAEARAETLDPFAPAKKPAGAPPLNGAGDEARTFPLKNPAEEARPIAPAPVRVNPTVTKPPSNPALPSAKARPAAPEWENTSGGLHPPLGVSHAASTGSGGSHPPLGSAHTPLMGEDESSAASRGFVGLLYVLVLLSGLALAVWTLLVPLLPPEWLPR